MNLTAHSVVEGIVERTLRRSGFTGEFTVSNVRRNKRGWSATVVTTYGGATRRYRAALPDGGKVRLVATTPVAKIGA